MDALRVHVKQIGIKVGGNTFGYDAETGTLFVLSKFNRLVKEHGFIFKEVSRESWQAFCNNPSRAGALSYWFSRGRLVPTAASITFMGVWEHDAPAVAQKVLAEFLGQKAA